MARYLKIEDGKVVNAIELDNPALFTDLVLVRSDSADIGDLFDGSVFTKPVPTPNRVGLMLQIDADTDAIYRAVEGDRTTEYLRAEEEAKAFKEANYTGTVPDSVASWASAKGESATWATDDILTTATGWRQAQSSIRATRLSCKEQARTANDLAPIAAQWAGFVVAIKTALGV
ncbi:MAG: hypothetical protein IPN06_20270 [Burkholderiales bacterium]|nr:hypothetical protein [Burkholderiales bacterium]